VFSKQPGNPGGLPDPGTAVGQYPENETFHKKTIK
jgi:hypothetical protein